jgi:hypothetical protein
MSWFRKHKSEEKSKVYVYTPEPERKPYHHAVYVYPLQLRGPQFSYSIILKDKFCEHCEKGEIKAKLIQINHTSALYGCNTEKCSQKILFKFPLGVPMN